MAKLNTEYAISTDKNPSEGDLKIYSYIKEYGQDYYDDVITTDKNFQVFNQLSELRTGLFSWYPFEKSSAVLEIGAGFGALTGLLCDRCGSVTATERVDFRAEAIAKRWKNKDNLTIYSGEWTNIEFKQKFDYVILVGILEYAGTGSGDTLVYSEYLRKLSCLLKENGKLLVAVENRLGLKYFCGAPEPHTNRAFDGINGYKRGTKGRSFTRKEIENIVKEAGLENFKFYYPLPDYKLPQLIYTDEHLPEKNVRERIIPYYKRNDTLIAYEKELYNDIADNNAFSFMANSFLVECGHCINFCDVVYAAISTDRGDNRSFSTSIHTDKKVRKVPLHEEGCSNAKKLYCNIMDLKEHGIPVVEHKMLENGCLVMPFVELPTLSNYIKDIIRKDTEEFIVLLDRIYNYILQSSKEVSPENNELKGNFDFGVILENAYIELIPLNCFYNPENGEFLYFDQEFVKKNYPAKYIMFRAIHYIYAFTPNAECYYPKQKLIEKYGMTETWKIFEQEEKNFLNEVRNHERYSQFYEWAKVDFKQIDSNIKRLEGKTENSSEYVVTDKMKKVWKVELNILDEIDRICKKYNLQYYLVHGSLLGAVRHRGFVPWDDDLDIAMSRRDYDTFIEVAKQELKTPLSVHTPDAERDVFWGGYARVRDESTTGIEEKDLGHFGNLGIWVDILPFDVCTSDDKKFQKKMKKIRNTQRLLYAKIYGKDYNKYADMTEIQWKMYRVLSKMFGHKSLNKKLKTAMKLYTGEETEYIAFFGSYYKHRRLYAKDFEEPKYLEFEKRQCPVPCGYENYLFMTMGGDYMKYPPKEEQKPKHKGIFDPDTSYKKYKELFCGMFEGCRNKEIILFGSGMMFEDYMQKYGGKYKPKFIVDNDKNKWGRKRMGIEIEAPEKLLSIPTEKRHIIICSYYYKEISKQLDEMGITDYKVYVQKVEWILKTEQER